MKTTLLLVVAGLAGCSVGSIGPAGDRESGPEGPFTSLDHPIAPREPTQAELTLGNRDYVASVLQEIFTPTGHEPDIDDILSQEIRGSLYHSKFLDMLAEVNASDGWRKLIGVPDPDLHMKDIETILRGVAMLVRGSQYTPSMTTFLNSVCRRCKAFSAAKVNYFRRLFESFVDSCAGLGRRPFKAKTGQFNISLFEAVFAAVASGPYKRGELIKRRISKAQLAALKRDRKFIQATESETASKPNVSLRLKRARTILR